MNIPPKKKKILLIEDEESIRDAIKFILDPLYDVTALNNTLKAAAHLDSERFDLVLLNIRIRGEGEEGSLNLLNTINKKHPKLPVIMLSGSVIWVNKWPELRKLGAYGYISKPFDTDKIKEIIERCIGGEKMNEIW